MASPRHLEDSARTLATIYLLRFPGASRVQRSCFGSQNLTFPSFSRIPPQNTGIDFIVEPKYSCFLAMNEYSPPPSPQRGVSFQFYYFTLLFSHLPFHFSVLSSSLPSPPPFFSFSCLTSIPSSLLLFFSSFPSPSSLPPSLLPAQLMFLTRQSAFSLSSPSFPFSCVFYLCW